MERSICYVVDEQGREFVDVDIQIVGQHGLRHDPDLLGYESEVVLDFGRREGTIVDGHFVQSTGKESMQVGHLAESQGLCVGADTPAARGLCVE